MKAYTNLEQSKKLAEILPIGSNDMFYEPSAGFNTQPSEVRFGNIKYAHPLSIPCWSLAALLGIIPYPTLGKHADETWSCASWVEKVNPYFVEGCDSPINACYEMILKLNEQKIL